MVELGCSYNVVTGQDNYVFVAIIFITWIDFPDDNDVLTAENTDDSNHDGGDKIGAPLREQDRFLPIANVAKIMKKAIPESGKVHIYFYLSSTILCMNLPTKIQKIMLSYFAVTIICINHYFECLLDCKRCQRMCTRMCFWVYQFYNKWSKRQVPHGKTQNY